MIASTTSNGQPSNIEIEQLWFYSNDNEYYMWSYLYNIICNNNLNPNKM